MVTTQISITVFEVNGQEIVEVKSGADIVSDYSTLTSKQKELLRNIASNQQPKVYPIVNRESARSEQRVKADELSKTISELTNFIEQADRNKVGDQIVLLAEKELMLQTAELKDLEEALSKKLPY